MRSCYLHAVALESALGSGYLASLERLRSGQPLLTRTDQYSPGRPLPLGLHRVDLPAIELTEGYWHSRNNRMALAALNQIRPQVEEALGRYAPERIAVVIGTSTSGISDSERGLQQRALNGEMPADYDYRRQEMGRRRLSSPKYCRCAAPFLAYPRRVHRGPRRWLPRDGC